MRNTYSTNDGCVEERKKCHKSQAAEKKSKLKTFDVLTGQIIVFNCNRFGSGW